MSVSTSWLSRDVSAHVDLDQRIRSDEMLDMIDAASLMAGNFQPAQSGFVDRGDVPGKTVKHCLPF